MATTSLRNRLAKLEAAGAGQPMMHVFHVSWFDDDGNRLSEQQREAAEERAVAESSIAIDEQRDTVLFISRATNAKARSVKETT